MAELVGVTIYSLINQVSKNEVFASRESNRKADCRRNEQSDRRNSELRKSFAKTIFANITIISNSKSTQKREDLR